jgi:hypothetical protein
MRLCWRTAFTSACPSVMNKVSGFSQYTSCRLARVNRRRVCQWSGVEITPRQCSCPQAASVVGVGCARPPLAFSRPAARRTPDASSTSTNRHGMLQ